MSVNPITATPHISLEVQPTTLSTMSVVQKSAYAQELLSKYSDELGQNNVSHIITDLMEKVENEMTGGQAKKNMVLSFFRERIIPHTNLPAQGLYDMASDLIDKMVAVANDLHKEGAAAPTGDVPLSSVDQIQQPIDQIKARCRAGIHNADIPGIILDVYNLIKGLPSQTPDSIRTLVIQNINGIIDSTNMQAGEKYALKTLVPTGYDALAFAAKGLLQLLPHIESCCKRLFSCCHK